MKYTQHFFSLCALLFCTAASAQDAHHGELTAGGSLYFRAEPVNNFFNEKTNELYYYVHLQGTEKSPDLAKKRVPLNLSVVIDRSGSMSGDKLAYTKEAVKYLVGQLGDNDILSIVLYDTEVDVFLEPQRIGNKDKLLKRINDIMTESSTNLEGGIRKGFELAKRGKKLSKDELVSRVILLSDGLANVGISDPGQLSDITRNAFEKERISISTFGVGSDYDEDLMGQIAMQGGGKYYFIDSPEKLPALFDEELQGVSQVIAKNTMLKITFPADVLSYERTYAYNSVLKGNTLEISFNDIFAKEQKSLLIAFKMKSRPAAPFSIECALSYSNTAGAAETPVSDKRISVLNFTKDEKELSAGYNRAASEGYALEVSAELYEEAVKLCDREKFDEAKEKTEAAISLLGDHFKKTGENIFLRDFQKKLIDYKDLIEDMKHMDRETLRINIKSRKAMKFRTIACPSF